MDDVDINAATPWQLQVLLGLTRDEVEAVLLARPLTDADAPRAALPDRLRDVRADRRIQKLNVNATSVRDLVRFTGMTTAEAQRLVDERPFFLMSQVRTLLSEAAYTQTDALFTTPPITYVDKLTGHETQLSPDPSRVLVSRRESESVSRVVSNTGMSAVYPEATGSIYEVLAVPETESDVDVLRDLRRSYGRNVLPAYRDPTTTYRYLNPKFCSVQFNPDVGEDREQEILRAVGVQVEEKHRTPGLYTVRIEGASEDPAVLASVIGRLNETREVRFAEPNYLGFDDRERLGPRRPIPSSEAESLARMPWNLELVRAQEAWKTTRGSPQVVVAVIDSGVDSEHPSLSRGLLRPSPTDRWDFTPAQGAEDTWGHDEDGHGTFIAGLLVGNGTGGVQGLCPECRVLALKVPMTGEPTSYARRRDAILYAAGLGSATRRVVISLSWKTAGDVALIRDAVTTASGLGAVVVASAGNSPSRENEAHYPSDYPVVIAVGAVGPARERAHYSYFGDLVDMAAPGGVEGGEERGILSAAPKNSTTVGWGTSFAAPHVAGCAALLVAANPGLSADEIRFAIEGSATPVRDTGLGHGLLDAEGALGRVSPRPQPVAGLGGGQAGLRLVNTADAQTLVGQLGLLPITVRVILARRPFADLSQVRGSLGLSQQQYEALERLT